MHGKVKWFDSEKRFGFIAMDDGGDAFAHGDRIIDGSGRLYEGQRVFFEINATDKGMRAVEIRTSDEDTILTGTVQNFDNDRGFGHIRCCDCRPDEFFHFTGLAPGVDRLALLDKQVSFIVVDTCQGRRAVRVTVLKPDSRAGEGEELIWGKDDDASWQLGDNESR